MKRARENSESIYPIVMKKSREEPVYDIIVDFKYVCDHGRPKHQCKACGTGHCKHGILKYRCRECGTGRYKL